MTSEIKASLDDKVTKKEYTHALDDEVIKTKNPKRVSAGKKGAEAKKMKAELKRKEMEAMKKENIQLKSITKDDDEVKEVQRVNIYKNYIPLCLIGVFGLGLYMYKSKQVAPVVQKPAPTIRQKKSIHLSLSNQKNSYKNDNTNLWKTNSKHVISCWSGNTINGWICRIRKKTIEKTTTKSRF